MQVEKRPASNYGHIWHSGVPWRPPAINLHISLIKSKLCACTQIILEGCPWSCYRPVGSLHGLERPPCNCCPKKSLQKQVCETNSWSKHGFVQVQWDEFLAALWLWWFGFWIRLLLLCPWCPQNDKSEFHKKQANQPKHHVTFVQSMPAVPENSRLLTGISVEESQDLDIESPESTSQVIISLLLWISVYFSGNTAVTGCIWSSAMLSSVL